MHFLDMQYVFTLYYGQFLIAPVLVAYKGA